MCFGSMQRDEELLPAGGGAGIRLFVFRAAGKWEAFITSSSSPLTADARLSAHIQLCCLMTKTAVIRLLLVVMRKQMKNPNLKHLGA